MLSALLAALLAAPQSLPSAEELAPVGLTVVCVAVDQGDATVLRTPDGAVHVIDGGPDGAGRAAVLPVVTQLLAQPGSRRGHTFATHYDRDHIGGLDEVRASSTAWGLAYDRGSVRVPGHASYTAYVASAGSRRSRLIAGQRIPLGGGVVATVITADGGVSNGTVVPVTGAYQEENARSASLRIDYGDFSLWVGGDLTGGGNGTADVETAAGLACGDVDVYQVNHHGSNTSSNAAFVARLDPELCVVSAGAGNPFFHPTPSIINRLNARGAARLLTCTTQGAAGCGGQPCVGFAETGNLTIETDGRRYRATAELGGHLDLFVDELALPATAADVRISEVHRDPQRVSDDRGEYVELTNVGASPVSLRGVRLAVGGTSFTLATSVALLPGRPVVLQRDGIGSRNGGQPLGVVAPFGGLMLNNGGDTLSVHAGAVLLDRLTWNATFPGGSGVAAERLDLLGPSQATNFASSTRRFGSGDRGTPGARNSVDATNAPATLAVESMPGLLHLRAGALSAGGGISILGLAFSANTGFAFGPLQIPLDVDPLFVVSVSLPGFAWVLPAEGYRSVPLALPVPNSASGTSAFAAHIVLGTSVSAAVPFVFR